MSKDKPAARCTQCGQPMSPVDVMLGPVCGPCCRANQKEVTGR